MASVGAMEPSDSPKELQQDLCKSTYKCYIVTCPSTHILTKVRVYVTYVCERERGKSERACVRVRVLLCLHTHTCPRKQEGISKSQIIPKVMLAELKFRLV
jgi:hypothetical protein